MIVHDCNKFIFSALRSPKTSLHLLFVASGTGASMDIVIASVRAYVGALNKLLGIKKQKVEEYAGTEATQSL